MTESAMMNRQGYPITFVVLAAYAILTMLFASKSLWESMGHSSAAESMGPSTAAANDEKIMEKIMEEKPSLSQGCQDFDEGIDHLLAKYQQIFIIAPAKAAGTTFIQFSLKCMDSTRKGAFSGNILNKNVALKSAFQEQLKLPTVVASHALNAETMCRLSQHATRDSLIIYSHREETNRFLSAIKYVVYSRFCFGPEERRDSGKVSFVKGKGKAKECHIQESVLMETIQKREQELAIGNTMMLTCEVYDCIRENRPNLLFMNYKQASKLQKLLAKHHCPEVGEEVKENMASEKHQSVFVDLEGAGTNNTQVPLEEWLEAKSQMLELVFRSKRDVSCQGTTRDIEDGIFACPDETLLLSGQSDYTTFPF